MTPLETVEALARLAELTQHTVLCRHCKVRNKVTRDQEDGHDGATCGACHEVMWYPTCWECVTDKDAPPYDKETGCAHVAG